MKIIKSIVFSILIVVATCNIYAYKGYFSLTDTSQTSLDAKLFIIPFATYSQKTRWGGGLMNRVLISDLASEGEIRPSRAGLTLFYTQEKQIDTRFDLSSYIGEYFIDTELKYAKYPSSFHGIGRDVTKDDKEEYTSERQMFFFKIRRNIISDFGAGIKYEIRNDEIKEPKEDGSLELGLVPGFKGGINSSAGFILNWDTRDNVLYSSSGEYINFEMDFFDEAIGSDYNYHRIELDARKFFSFRPDHIIGLHLYYKDTYGDVPFYMMSLMGGKDHMRAYKEGFFRDKKYLALQTEYRFPIYEIFGGVFHVGAGDVASSIDEIEISEFKYFVGLGLRIRMLPREKFNFRIDYSIGENSKGFYIGASEAF